MRNGGENTMSRYIDADNAIERLGEYLMTDAQIEYGGLASEDIDDWKPIAIDILKGAPSIDIEPKRGEWIDMGDFEQCSVCKGTHLKEFQSYYGKTTWIKTPYCPNCGAKMKGADDE